MKRLNGLVKPSVHKKYPFNRLVVIAIILVAITNSACTSPSTKTSLPTSGQVNPTGTTDSINPLPSETLSPTSTLVQHVGQAATLAPTYTKPIFTLTPEASPTVVTHVTFGVIGDYGTGHSDEEHVANLILGWQPDFIITVGDNNYDDGSAYYMDTAVGQFFHSYIYPYIGKFGEGSEVNRFFPTLGNHDVITDFGKPYLDYFALPGNERYYDFTWGPLHLFALDNIETEPDGVGASSKQAQWLKAGLAASTSPWNIVYMHFPPYSSGTHGSTDWARWPYKEWGADAVLAGHDHTYERLEEGGLVYFVNGLGGGGRYDFTHSVEGSIVRYNSDYGAMRVEATETSITFEFITVLGTVVDRYEINK